jgi:hypothetical protein
LNTIALVSWRGRVAHVQLEALRKVERLARNRVRWSCSELFAVRVVLTLLGVRV